jgi:siroheme synthase (precorrin-2 oxidase/ferrochelatase)
MPRIKIVVKVDSAIESQETVIVIQPSTPKAVKHLTQDKTWRWEEDIVCPPKE